MCKGPGWGGGRNISETERREVIPARDQKGVEGRPGRVGSSQALCGLEAVASTSTQMPADTSALRWEFGPHLPLPTPGGLGQGTTRAASPDSPDEEAPDLASGLTPSSWSTPLQPPVSLAALALFPTRHLPPGAHCFGPPQCAGSCCRTWFVFVSLASQLLTSRTFSVGQSCVPAPSTTSLIRHAIAID